MYPSVRVGLAFGLAAAVALMRTALALLSAPFTRSARRRLGGQSFGCGFRKAFARFDRSGIASDVPNQPILLGVGDQGFMHELWELHLGELGEGSGKRRFVRHLADMIPSADSAQLLVLRSRSSNCRVRLNP